MKVSGKRIQLQPIQEEDFSQLVKWTLDPTINAYSEGNYPSSVEECHKWHKKAQSNRYQEKFAIYLDDKIIGDIELDHITWRSGDAELRVRIGEKALWDQGLGTDAVITLLKHGFLTMNLSRVYLRVYTDNHRAIRCYQKAGFKKEGRLRRAGNDPEFRDIFLMRILKDEFLRRHQILTSAS